mgnify:FL=1
MTRLKSGDFVGVASLIRGAPCEEVRAASELVAYSLSDDHLLELISNDSSIATACRNHLWEAELAALLQSRLERTPKQSRPVGSLLNELLQMARMLDASNASVIRNALGEGQRLFLASQLVSTETVSLGDELSDSQSISVT